MQRFSIAIDANASMCNKPGMRTAFDLGSFLPYVLNQTAERIGKEFEPVYRDEHDLSRTQWRILAHLGTYGDMTAAAVSRQSLTEKTKVSRAVAALEERALVVRLDSAADRRTEQLRLTPAGAALFDTLSAKAAAFDRQLRDKLGPQDAAQLERLLSMLAS